MVFQLTICTAICVAVGSITLSVGSRFLGPIVLSAFLIASVIFSTLLVYFFERPLNVDTFLFWLTPLTSIPLIMVIAPFLIGKKNWSHDEMNQALKFSRKLFFVSATAAAITCVCAIAGFGFHSEVVVLPGFVAFPIALVFGGIAASTSLLVYFCRDKRIDPAR